MDPLSLALTAAAVIGASAVRKNRKAQLQGASAIVQYSLVRITNVFVTSTTKSVVADSSMYGAELQKILAYNQRQSKPIEHEQVYELVTLLGHQLRNVSLKITEACATNYQTSKALRPQLYDALHRKICQNTRIPKKDYEALALTVQQVVDKLFKVIYRKVKRMRLKQQLRKHLAWTKSTRTMPTTSGTYVDPKSHIKKIPPSQQ